MNFLNKRCFVELLTQSPSFLMTKLADGAFITKVRKAHPEVLNREIVLNVGFRA